MFLGYSDKQTTESTITDKKSKIRLHFIISQRKNDDLARDKSITGIAHYVDVNFDQCNRAYVTQKIRRDLGDESLDICDTNGYPLGSFFDGNILSLTELHTQ